jgi:hypothetical protein
VEGRQRRPLEEPARRLEILVRLAGKTDDDVRAKGRVGRQAPEALENLRVIRDSTPCPSPKGPRRAAWAKDGCGAMRGLCRDLGASGSSQEPRVAASSGGPEPLDRLDALEEARSELRGSRSRP